MLKETLDNLKSKLKLVGIGFVLGVACCFGIYELNNKDVVPDIKQDVKPPIVKQDKPVDPNNIVDLRDRAFSPITIARKLNGEIYEITATDGYKSTTVFDKITFPNVITRKYSVGASASLLHTGTKIVDMYGGYIFYHSIVDIGGGVQVDRHFENKIISAHVGFSF